MATQTPTPSIKATAFACPNCGAYAKQTWFTCHGNRQEADSPTPYVPRGHEFDKQAEEAKNPNERQAFSRMATWSKKMAQGEPFLEKGHSAVDVALCNIFVSQCFNCDRPALWVYDRLLYPAKRMGAEPSADMPDDVRADYDEARTILELSPRGAAALLRLAVQKFCKHLGERGEDINTDIGRLVAKGLDEAVQEALDALRVIGNEAVHPGQIDLRDDRDTAAQLFDLLNDITAQTVTRKKRREGMLAKIPPAKLEAIRERNAKARGAAK